MNGLEFSRKCEKHREENLTSIITSIREQEQIIETMGKKNEEYRWKEILVTVGLGCGAGTVGGLHRGG